MFAVISLFFPTFISLYIIKKREKKSYKDLMFYYPIYNVIINFIVFLIYMIWKKTELIMISEHFLIMQFNLKYMLIASIIAAIIPYVREFVVKNISFKLEIRKDMKNEK